MQPPFKVWGGIRKICGESKSFDFGEMGVYYGGRGKGVNVTIESGI